MNSIKVTLVAYPDGSTVWIKDATNDDIIAANKAWRGSLSDEQRERHEAARSCGGAVIVTMPEQDYLSIPATNHPALLALQKGGNDSE